MASRVDHRSSAGVNRSDRARQRAAWAIFVVWLSYSGALLWQVENEQQLGQQICRTGTNQP